MDDQLFFAWLDGELDGDSAARVAAQVAADPLLQRRAAAHRALRTRLAGAFAPVAAAPLPAAILTSADGPRVIDLAAARARQASRRGLPSLAQWAAIAATLVLGVAGGSMLGGGSTAPVRTEAGQLLASAGLAQALDTRLASAPEATGPRIGLTFRDAAGSICRSFTDGAAEGLACREGQGWRIRGLVQGARGPGGEFRMAAGADPLLAALVDSAIAGEPFDAVEERRARSTDWR